MTRPADSRLNLGVSFLAVESNFGGIQLRIRLRLRLGLGPFPARPECFGLVSLKRCYAPLACDNGRSRIYPEH
jgi:hypothetical protein